MKPRHMPAAALAFLLFAGPASAEGDSPVGETITFVVSTGFWEAPAEDGDAAKPDVPIRPSAPRRWSRGSKP